MTAEYGAAQIKVLEWLEPIRQRPGMYIGSTDTRGLHHMIWEIVDNGVDEAIAGYCNNITVIFDNHGRVTVVDDGRWIPTGKHPKTGKSALETVMTVLHAGGKFNKDVYKISGGLHGVGASVVNALSTDLTARVHREGKIFEQSYKIGIPTGEIEVVWKSDYRGTIIAFKSDKTIFDTTVYNWNTIATRLLQGAYLTPGVTFTVIKAESFDNKPLLDIAEMEDIQIVKRKRFHFKSGIKTFLRNLMWDRKIISNQFYLEKEGDNVLSEMALAYVGENNDNIISFVNNIHTPDGGSHLNGFKAWLLRAINEFAKWQDLLDKKIWDLQLGDVTSWLYAIVTVKIPEPQFEGQTKWRLGNAYVRKVVEKQVYEFMKKQLSKDEDLGRIIVERVKLNAKARVAAKLARETVMRKNVISTWVLPGKLTDCSNKKREGTELYIVEGNSAGGSAKQGRDSSFQAILPLKGKILNTEKIGIDKVLANEEVKSLILALGCGLKETYNEETLRYDKIVIMTDADVDGAHIKTLLLTFFYRYMKQLIENGHLFIAVSPIFKFKQGKKEKYIYPPEYDSEEAMKRVWFSPKKTTIQRYKGLGEMNPKQLWDTTMDPEKRKMLQVTIGDATEADNMFSTLMGSDVLSRRQFILTHAKNIRNLDI